MSRVNPYLNDFSLSSVVNIKNISFVSIIIFLGWLHYEIASKDNTFYLLIFVFVLFISFGITIDAEKDKDTFNWGLGCIVFPLLTVAMLVLAESGVHFELRFRVFASLASSMSITGLLFSLRSGFLFRIIVGIFLNGFLGLLLFFLIDCC